MSRKRQRGAPPASPRRVLGQRQAEAPAGRLSKRACKTRARGRRGGDENDPARSPPAAGVGAEDATPVPVTPATDDFFASCTTNEQLEARTSKLLAALARKRAALQANNGRTVRSAYTYPPAPS